ncbi:MAG TPA: hypothetical protein VF329_01725 [Gammaproteobacteria bacterium]
MTTKTTRLIAVLAGGLVSATAHFLFYDPVQNAPAFLKPALIIFWGAVLFLGTNISVFSFNLLRVLLSVRGLEDEQEIERIVEPALRGRLADERMLRYTDIPLFAGIGMILAGVLIRLLR